MTAASDYSLFRRPAGFSEEATPASKHWKLIPWLCGVALSPLLFGTVNSLEQAIVGTLFGLSILLLLFELRGSHLRNRTLSFGWISVLLLGIIIPLIPLPIELVRALSPERVKLAQQFPLISGDLPSYLTLTISPAATLRRLWEISLVVACFCLARVAGQWRMDRALSLTLSSSLLILSVSDIWYRLWGRGKLLGIWPDSANHAAGTFANRNHFADWIYVASLFILGWILGKPSYEEEGDLSKKATVRAGLEIAFCAASVSLAIFMAVLSGSRAGLLAALVGFVAGSFLLNSVTRSKKLRLTFVTITIVLSLIFVSSSNYILNRFVSDGGTAFKASIWRDAWHVAQKFSLTGAGLGTFERAFSHYKTFGPQSTFLYAENEVIQLILESGFIVGTLFLSLLSFSFFNLFRFARRAGEKHSEVIIGGFAALVVFCVHSLFEFVFQITATALLAAVLFGYLNGIRDRSLGPMLLPPISVFRILANLTFALGLLVLAAVQFFAWRDFRNGQRLKSAEMIGNSLRLWPLTSDRIFAYIPLARSEFIRNVTLTRPVGSAIDPVVEHAIARDPLNWRLRYEAFPLRTRELPLDAANEANRIIRLNPLQSALPLFFAREFAKQDPENALQFMRAAAQFPENLNSVLDLAWKLNPVPAFLWRVIPAGDAPLQALGDYALNKSLAGLAASAFQRISEKELPEKRADNYIRAGRADLALQIPLGNTVRANLLRGRAYLQLGQYSEALRAADLVFTQQDAEGRLSRADSQAEIDPQQASVLAKGRQIMSQPARARDRTQLRHLAETSRMPRIYWMLLQTERELGLYDSAAETAVQLAGELMK